MKPFFVAGVLLLMLLVTPAFAADNPTYEITVLDPSTFLWIDTDAQGKEVIQLYKIEDGEIVLVDAVLVEQKTVNYKTLLEYTKIKIEKKD